MSGLLADPISLPDGTRGLTHVEPDPVERSRCPDEEVSKEVTDPLRED